MTGTATTAVRVPREAAALGGVAWAYLAALTRGTRGAAEATSILTTFRELFNENRAASVDGLVAVGGTRATAESITPATLRPGATVTADDATAIAISIYPVTELGRLGGETRWGDGDALFAIFSDVPVSPDELRSWFLDRLANVWPQGTSNPHGRLLWWFATSIASGEDASRVFVQYVFQGRDEPEPLAAGASSIQDAAAAVAAGSSPTAIELPGVAITARPSGWRSARWFYVGLAVLIAVGMSSLGLWYYQRRYGRLPWQKRGR